MGARIVCSQAAHDEPVEGEYLREVDARIGRLRGALVPQLRDELCLDRAEERVELADLVPQLGSEVGAALQPLDALLRPFLVEVVVLPRSVLRALEQLAKLHEPLGPRRVLCAALNTLPNSKALVRAGDGSKSAGEESGRRRLRSQSSKIF